MLTDKTKLICVCSPLHGGRNRFSARGSNRPPFDMKRQFASLRTTMAVLEAIGETIVLQLLGANSVVSRAAAGRQARTASAAARAAPPRSLVPWAAVGRSTWLFCFNSSSPLHTPSCSLRCARAERLVSLLKASSPLPPSPTPPPPPLLLRPSLCPHPYLPHSRPTSPSVRVLLSFWSSVPVVKRRSL